jgi:PAS domain S-box-containing protein
MDRVRVLLVSSDDHDAEGIRAMLADRAFVVSRVRGLDEALEALDRGRPDVVLTELTDASRREVLRALVDPACPPVVVLSDARDDEGTAASVLDYGAQDYLIRGSFDAALLEHALRHAVRRYGLVLRQAAQTREALAVGEAAESAHRASEERFTAFMHASPVLAWIKDSDGRFVWVNRAWERTFGVTRADCVGRTLPEVLPPTMSGWFDTDDDVVLTPVSQGGGMVHDVVTADDPPRFWERVRFAFPDGNGGLNIGALGVDITERRRAEENLAKRVELMEHAQALESLGQLAGGVAHDFNNLLGVILNYTTLLDRRIEDPPAREFVAEIRAAADRGAALTKQLLTFARRTEIEAEPVDLREVVTGVASMLERTVLEHRGIRLDLPRDPVCALGDRRQIEQVMLNLAVNARDAMPEGGTLTISVSDAADEDQVEFVFRDTGTGMPPEVAARVFEPFFTTKPRGHGTGLGLAMVHSTVTQSGGSVTLQSAPGAGTAVTVRLPRCASPGGGADAAEPAPVGVGAGRRLLLVEDESPLRAGMAALLAEHGFQVDVAADGESALRILEREPGAFSAVVTDVSMPKMRGDELATELAARGYDVPLLFLSGYRSADRPVPGPLLAKPVSERDLLDALARLLDGDRTDR